jgi:hypothetical protein
MGPRWRVATADPAVRCSGRDLLARLSDGAAAAGFRLRSRTAASTAPTTAIPVAPRKAAE